MRGTSMYLYANMFVAEYDYGNELVIKGWGRSGEEVPLWRRARQAIISEEKEALNISMTWAVCKSVEERNGESFYEQTYICPVTYDANLTSLCSSRAWSSYPYYHAPSLALSLPTPLLSLLLMGTKTFRPVGFNSICPRRRVPLQPSLSH